MLPKLSQHKAVDREPLYLDVEPPVYPSLHDVKRERNDRRVTFWLRSSIVAVSFMFLIVYAPYFVRSRTYPVERAAAAPSTTEVYSAQFLQFLKTYNREYSTPEETMAAFTAYEKNMRSLEQYKKDHPSAEFGETEYSDWSDEKFAEMLLPLDHYKRLRESATFIRRDPPQLERAAPQPDHFDWRAYNVVTPVKAQGSCGSCWAFAATATLEAAWAIGHGGELRNLSEQTLLDCDMSNDACNGGDEDKAFRFIHREGLAYNDEYPYVAHRQNVCSANANRTRLQVAYFLNPDEKSMIDWLVNFGPVNIGMSVTQPMRSYKGGVFHPTEYACKNEVIGLHALLVVGYGTSEQGEKYWIIKNSWGQSYGVENGYIYFARGVNACFIEDEPVGVLA